MNLFHVTPLQNLQSIVTNGFKPMIGLRSAELGISGEPHEATYFFADEDAAFDALSNWLGEAFAQDEELVILEVDVPDDATRLPSAAYEIAISVPIASDRIVRVMNENFEPFTDSQCRALAAKGWVIPYALVNAVETELDVGTICEAIVSRTSLSRWIVWMDPRTATSAKFKRWLASTDSTSLERALLEPLQTKNLTEILRASVNTVEALSSLPTEECRIKVLRPALARIDKSSLLLDLKFHDLNKLYTSLRPDQKPTEALSSQRAGWPKTGLASELIDQLLTAPVIQSAHAGEIRTAVGLLLAKCFQSHCVSPRLDALLEHAKSSHEMWEVYKAIKAKSTGPSECADKVLRYITKDLAATASPISDDSTRTLLGGEASNLHTKLLVSTYPERAIFDAFSSHATRYDDPHIDALIGTGRIARDFTDKLIHAVSRAAFKNPHQRARQTRCLNTLLSYAPRSASHGDRTEQTSMREDLRTADFSSNSVRDLEANPQTAKALTHLDNLVCSPPEIVKCHLLQLTTLCSALKELLANGNPAPANPLEALVMAATLRQQADWHETIELLRENGLDVADVRSDGGGNVLHKIASYCSALSALNTAATGAGSRLLPTSDHFTSVMKALVFDHGVDPIHKDTTGHPPAYYLHSDLQDNWNAFVMAFKAREQTSLLLSEIQATPLVEP